MYSVTEYWVIHEREVFFGSQFHSQRSPRTWHACVPLLLVRTYFRVESRGSQARRSERHRQAWAASYNLSYEPHPSTRSSEGQDLFSPQGLVSQHCPGSSQSSVSFQEDSSIHPHSDHSVPPLGAYTAAEPAQSSWIDSKPQSPLF